MSRKPTDVRDDDGSARFILALGLPVAIVAVALPWFLFGDRLPDPVASHFDLGGRPDGSSSQRGFLFSTGGLAALGIALCVATALFSRNIPRPYAPVAALLGGFLGGLGSAILAVTAITQRDVSVWTDASSPGWWVAVVVALAALLGGVGARLGNRLPQADRPASARGRPAERRLELGDGERAVWAATQDAPWALGGSLVLIAIGVVGAVLASWPLVFLAVVGVAVSALARVHARADLDGLHVRYGFLPWPTTRIAIDRIAEASVLHVRPLDWGGWGYRGSLKLMDQAAVVHRAGPGLRLDLTDGKVFVITVDDPDGAAAVLSAGAPKDPHRQSAEPSPRP